MAQQLMRQWRLAVLRASLDLGGTAPTVLTELVTFPDGRETVVWSLELGPEAFGMATYGRRFTEPVLRVPDELVGGVLGAVAEHVGPEAGLWLHVEEPRGYLGAVPWEAAIGPGLEGPMLRIPNRLPVAAPRRRAYRMALLASAAEPARIVPHILGTVSTLSARLSQQLDLELFADAGVLEVLAGDLSNLPISGEVVVHDPGEAMPMAERRWHQSASRKTRTSTTPLLGPAQVWGAWVTGTARSRSIGAVHLVSDGTLDGDRGMLAVAARPTEPVDRSTVSYVHADEVRRLADVAGAEVLVVDSAPGNPSELASRLLADVVGVNRPGPTVFGAAQLDPDGQALAAAHAFLAAPPGEQPVPTDPAVFAYLQPERAQAAVVAEDSGKLMAYKAAPPSRMATRADQNRRDASDVDEQPWVDMTSHYIDTEVADLILDERAAARQSVTKAAYDEGRQRALHELQTLIQRHTGPS